MPWAILLQPDGLIGGWPNVQTPYIQLHEFEALILADPARLALEYIGQEPAIQRLVDMVSRKGGNPELIDDGSETAPSRRILAELPAYAKATAGPRVAAQIGMRTLCERCPHFREWVEKLTRLGGVE